MSTSLAKAKSGGTVVMTAGVPVPVPKKNVKAVKGGGIGGAVGALAGALLIATPLGIAVMAGVGAFTGAMMGARTDAQEQGR